MARYQVIAACVVAADRYFYRDAVLPKDVDDTAIAHLLSVGMIASVDDAPEEPAAPAEDEGPDDVTKMTIDQLKDYAQANDIDLAGVTKKDDIIAKIQAAQA